MSPLAHVLFAVSLLLPAAAMGGPRQHQPILIETQQSPLLLVANKRNLTEGVTAVIHPRGEFRKVGPNRWSENNGTFKFREVKDNGRTITLYDKSRDMFVYLNLRQEMIRWALNGDEPQDLYKIIGVIREDADEQVDEDEEADVPAKPKLARFTCEEGIPMVVRFEERGGRARIMVSIDGGPEMRLDQVKAGSGAKFANENYTVWLKGQNAMLEVDGNIDNCTGR